MVFTLVSIDIMDMWNIAHLEIVEINQWDGDLTCTLVDVEWALEKMVSLGRYMGIKLWVHEAEDDFSLEFSP